MDKEDKEAALWSAWVAKRPDAARLEGAHHEDIYWEGLVAGFNTGLQFVQDSIRKAL